MGRHAAASTLLHDAAREALAAAVLEAPDAWADRCHVIVRGTGAESGRWDTARTPYLRRPLRMFAHPAVRHLTLMTGSQLGKTSLVDILKQWVVDQDPGPAIVMYGNIDAARDYNQDRFLPGLRASPVMAGHLLPSPQDTKNLKITFDRMTMWFIGSNSRSGRRGRPARYLFLDEVSTYEEPRSGPSGRTRAGLAARTDPGWVEIYDRVKTFGDHKIVDTSTPEDEGTGIHALYQQGSREVFYVPCPECGAYQELLWKHLRFEGQTPDEARASARYACGACGVLLEEHAKAGMLAKGLWAPEGTDTPEEFDQESAPRAHLSFRVSSLYSPFAGATWGDMAARFVEQHRRMTPEFVCGWLGEPWRPLGDRVEIADLRRCVGGYRLGSVPPGALLLVASADVQKDRIYALVRGYGEFGRESWLIARAILPRVEGDGLAQLEAWLRTCKARAAFVDSGHFTAEVYGLARRLRGVMPVKGQETITGVPWRVSRIDRMPDGQAIPGGLALLHVNNDVWKTALMARMKGADPDPGTLEPETSSETSVPARRAWHLPEDVPADYLEQVTSETRAEVWGPRGLSYAWKLRPGRRDNHDLDAEVYGLAGADYLGVRLLRPQMAQPARSDEVPPRSGWLSEMREQWKGS